MVAELIRVVKCNMIDIKQIRKNPERFKKAAKDKNIKVDIDRLLELDSRLSLLKKQAQNIATEKNRVSKIISRRLANKNKV